MADSAPKVAAKECVEPPQAIEKKAQIIADHIKNSKHFVVFTGAGISTSAGIPDFRAPDGAWTLRAQGRQRTGKTVSTLQAIPTPTHMALVELQNRGYLKYLISQNCDGLHRKSGIASDRISELHGNSNRESCQDCGKEFIRDFRAVATYEKTVRDHRTGRKCARCGGALIDSIVNFGESLPTEVLQRAFDNAKLADLCLVLGSSLTVSPANEIPEVTGRSRNGKLVVCNLQATPLDNLVDTRVYSKTDDLMVQVMQNLTLSVPSFILHRRLLIGMISNNERHQMKISGVDEDNTPVTFLQSVKLEYNRRVVRSEPFVVGFRGPLAPGTELKVELEFMGHYREPDLEIAYRYRGGVDTESLYLLAYDPVARKWETEMADNVSEQSVIDLTDDTTILSDDLSAVAV
ncbi:DHS-like NAD/FAD-binding domain-containing protein [Cadophora sp. MPI-SDFR-AT-0126]|nr:DHS-like NAD/FAD-binding domain-containing protein [Leotiomycetes sp. MPI-SDFR-AT-0126]